MTFSNLINGRNKWDVFIVLFLFLIFGYSVSRIRYEMRWSAWAEADAGHLNSSIHLAHEGFRTHYFLIYHHPGYLGKVRGLCSPVGYYTRYPPLSVIINGLLIRWFGEDVRLLKAFSILCGTLALLGLYLVLGFFFSKRVAFIAAVFSGCSMGYLEFIDSVSTYSIYCEFFRFTILFLFLSYETKEKNRLRSSLFLSAIWTFLLLDSFQAFDYILFYPPFFVLYYYFSEKKLPFGKLLLFASAPVLGFALHFLQGEMALAKYGYNQFDALFNSFGLKTLPFYKGFFSVLSFITYFFREIQVKLQRWNYGFGFEMLFLMYGIIALLKYFKADIAQITEGIRDRLTLNKILIIFAIPSFSWWIVFPNHAASFSYTPLHLLPILSLLFGLALDGAINLYQDRKVAREFRLGGVFLGIGLVWGPMILNLKYYKAYPNLMDAHNNIIMGELMFLTQEQLYSYVQIAKKFKTTSDYGDIILAPRLFSLPQDFTEYYAQRRIDYYGGETVDALKKKIGEMQVYRKEGALKYPIFNPKLKILGLVDRNDTGVVNQYIAAHYKLQSEVDAGWALFNLEEDITYK